MASGLMHSLYQKIDDQAKWRREELSFLPAALELQESPPSPIGRTIVWTVVLLFAIAVAWAIIGQVDIVTVAQGKIIPSGRVKIIQPVEMGVVTDILVEEGQQVQAGDSLIILDGTSTESEQRQISNELLDARIRQLRQQHFLQTLNQDAGALPRLTITSAQVPPGIDEDLIAAKLAFQQNLLEQQLGEYQAQREELDSNYARELAARHTAESEVRRLQLSLPLLTERKEAYSLLLDQQLVARVSYLELEQTFVEHQQNLLTLQSRVNELELSLDTIDKNRQTLLAQTRRSVLQEQESTIARIETLEQELRRVSQRNRQQVLRAPISGTVQQLAVHTIGGVVTPAQELMLVVPEESHIEVEAYVQNRDIGFVEEGQSAEVKIDAFNFTQYGVIHGVIEHISSDAVNNEDSGLVYRTSVLLDSASILVGERDVNLSPGMMVSVEIKTGKRRLIEYFLSPLMRFKQESVRER